RHTRKRLEARFRKDCRPQGFGEDVGLSGRTRFVAADARTWGRLPRKPAAGPEAIAPRSRAMSGRSGEEADDRGDPNDPEEATGGRRPCRSGSLEPRIRPAIQWVGRSASSVSPRDRSAWRVRPNARGTFPVPPHPPSTEVNTPHVHGRRPDLAAP